MYTWMSRLLLLLLLLFLLLFFLLRLNPREQESRNAHAVELFLISRRSYLLYSISDATILLEQPLFFFSFVFATFVYSAIRMISPVSRKGNDSLSRQEHR